MEIEYASNPSWTDLGGTSINLTVKFSAFDFEVPFSASPQDSELHGRQLFARASAGEFGTVAHYIAPPPVVPTVVTMVQARLALLAIGLLDDVEAGISSMSKASQIEWEFRPTVERSSELVQSLAVALGLDSVALDELFTAASKL